MRSRTRQLIVAVFVGVVGVVIIAPANAAAPAGGVLNVDRSGPRNSSRWRPPTREPLAG